MRVDVVIPVYNEEKVLARSVEQLRAFLTGKCPYEWKIVIADNASVDKTLDVAKELSQKFSDVDYIHLDLKGRGRALRKAWTESDADIVSYMDVDLSTDLKSFPPLIQSLTEGYDVAIGSRLMRGAEVQRSFKREFISRSYNIMIKMMFGSTFIDAQCGFKALTRRAVNSLVPLIEDQAWFFDTELLLIAEKKGFKIKEIPVAWVEDPDTRVKIIKTAVEDIKGLLRVRFKSYS